MMVFDILDGLVWRFSELLCLELSDIWQGIHIMHFITSGLYVCVQYVFAVYFCYLSWGGGWAMGWLWWALLWSQPWTLQYRKKRRKQKKKKEKKRIKRTRRAKRMRQQATETRRWREIIIKIEEEGRDKEKDTGDCWRRMEGQRRIAKRRGYGGGQARPFPTKNLNIWWELLWWPSLCFRAALVAN